MSAVLQDRQADRIRTLVAAGKFPNEAAVIDAALDLLERRERFRAMVQEGIDAADRGEVVDHATVFGEARQIIAEAIGAQKAKASA